MERKPHGKPKILVINPNSTASMSESLKTMLAGHTAISEKCHITVVQPPTGPSSINNDDDAAESLPHCISYLNENSHYLRQQDGFLVACYSDHPLVGWLRETFGGAGFKPVLGIFQASAVKSVGLLRRGQMWGIVSTGDVWKSLLTEAVLGLDEREGVDAEEIKAKFGGVETTGLNATELHDAPWDEVRQRVKDATKRLMKVGYIGAICLGCAGMAGMDETVREAVWEELGNDAFKEVAVVDGVLAGVELLGEQLEATESLGTKKP